MPKTRRHEHQQLASDAAHDGIPAGTVQFATLASLWGCLTAIAAWRIAISLDVAYQPTLASALGAAVIHWRALDQFLAWIALAIVLLGGAGGLWTGSIRESRITTLLAIFLAIGMGLTALDIIWEQWNLGANDSAAPGGWATFALILMGLAVTMRQLHELSYAIRDEDRPGTAGVTILEVWRFITCQWVLMMTAAAAYLRLTTRHDDLMSNEGIRNLQFLLPAAGVLPNAMMATGIGLWRQQHVSTFDDQISPSRPRAWLIALLAFNLGAILMVLPTKGAAGGAGIAGAIAAIFGIAMYLAGFPKTTWRSLGGRTILGAWAMLGLASAWILIDRTMVLSGQPVSTFFGAAWRHVWVIGVPGLWLLGIMAQPQPTRSPTPGKAFLIAGGSLAAGVLITAGLMFMASTRTGESQISILRWLFIGTLPEAIAFFIGGTLLLRSIAINRRSRLSPAL